MIWVPILLSIGTILLILLLPFLRRRPIWMPFRGAAEGSDLRQKKEALLRAMKDVKFEYQIGTLSPEDRDGLLAGYRRRAAAVMKRLAALGETEPAESPEGLDQGPASGERGQGLV